MSRREAAAYLAGMIDGEGTIGQYGKMRRVGICNTDYALIEACAEACEILGLRYTIYPMGARRGKARRWDLIFTGGRRTFEALLQDVPIRSPKKRERLAAMLTTYKRPRRPDRWEIEQAYLNGASYSALAERYGTKVSTVQNWMRYYGIPARSLSEAGRLAWMERRSAV